MTLALALTALFPAHDRTAHACPAPPALAELVESADAVFVGTVVAIDSRTVDFHGRSYEQPTAVFRVDTPLKGDVRANGEVLLNYGFLGPVGEGDDRTVFPTVLLFVGASGDAYVMHAARDVSEEAARAAYVARVREMLDILALPEDAPERVERYIDWSVRCIEEPATRNDGIRDLTYATWHTYTEDEDGERVMPPLAPAYRERLITAFLASPSFDEWTTYSLLSHIAVDHDWRVVAALESEFARLAERPAPHVTNVMEALGEQLDWKTGSYLAGRFPSEASVEVQRAAIARFARLMSQLEELPEVLEAAEEPVEVEYDESDEEMSEAAEAYADEANEAIEALEERIQEEVDAFEPEDEADESGDA